MHKQWTLAASLLFAVSSYAQDTLFDRFSLDAQFGLNNPVEPMAQGYDARTLGPFHAGLGGRYMLNPQFGVRLQAAYDQFQNKDASDDFKTDYIRFSAEGVVNAGNLLRFHDWTDRVGLLVHAGAGYSLMYGEGVSTADRMVHAMAGITPQVKLTDRWVLSLDVSTVANVYQSRTYDFSETQLNRGVDGRLFNLSLGVQYNFGSGIHADWVAPEDKTARISQELRETQQRLEALQERTAEQDSRYDSIVRAMSDEDQDGVPAYLDQEPASAPGAVVNTKGVTVPKEAVSSTPDTAPDGFVEFPNKRELFYSVQVGFYRSPVDLQQEYGLSPLLQTTARTGETRYLYGTYRKLTDAENKRGTALQSGVTDAFVVAYYDGKRITIRQAEQLLSSNGVAILDPKK